MSEENKVLMIPLEFWLDCSMRKVKQTTENAKINVDYIKMMIENFIKESISSSSDEKAIQNLNEVIKFLKLTSECLKKAWVNLEKSENYYMINKNGHYFPDNLTWEIRK